MGYIRHNAIVVTTWCEDIQRAVDKASSLGLPVIGPSEQQINCYASFLVCPDGSKEGWEKSRKGDEARNEFKEWLLDPARQDEHLFFEWVEVAFGSDDANAEVTDHRWKEVRDDR